MIIKRLELQGFKTFPERTKIVFNTGITTIIGPNGTGKSNIVEAIQWVLGGQRVRSVRGEKIEDAIFSGTIKRPAMGMADVTLVLQNSEEEMQINHRVFRSGESEYRMDGKVVRLKDIQDELWKKAISENRYFVIEQGSIGTFVTSKPTEKRALIEEAAGTAYYKDKKRQAENKLEGSEQNLVRLEDIIAEVAKAKNSLARQAGAAERYRHLRERIRELTAHHFLQKSEQLQAGQQDTQSHYDLGLSAEREILAKLTAEEKSVNEKRKEAWDLEQALKQDQEDIFALRSQIARLEAERERESKRIEFFEEKRKKANADTDEFLAELLLFEKDILQAEADLRANSEAFLRKRQEAEDLERDHRNTEAGLAPWAKKVDALRGKYLLKFADVTEAKNEGSKLEKELELVRRQEEKIRQRQAETKARLEDKEREIAELEKDRERIEGEIADQEKHIAAHQHRLDETAGSIENLQNIIRGLREKRDEDSYHLQALRKLEEKERAAEPLFDVEGALGYFTDLLESDPADAPLIDVFWKEEARATVIGTEEFLKNLSTREIRGSFLLLPDRPSDRVPAALIDDPDVVGSLTARLRPSPKMKNRIPGLRDAVIVSDIRSAIRLWLRFPDLNFVSLKGDALFSTGLLKLGPQKEGLFTLIQEIKDLERKVSGRDAEIQPHALRLEEAVRLKQTLESEIKAGTVHLAEANKDIQDYEKRIVLARAEQENLTNDLALFVHEIEVLAMDRTGFRQKWESHAQVIRGLEEEEMAFRSRAEAEEKELALQREKANRETTTLLERRGSIDVLQEKIANLEVVLKAIGQRKDSAAAKIDALRSEIGAAEVEEARLKDLLVELGERLSAQEDQRGRHGSALADNEVHLQRIRNELAAAETGLAALREEHERKKDERMTWEIRKAEIDRDLINLEETCWQELKKTLQEVKAAPAEPAIGDVEAELEEAKEKLLKYGAVNLMAEEEYAAQKERYDFLTQQKKDLTESIAQTKEAIFKIDDESRQRFLTALGEVNTYFQDLFVTLFKGGTAEVKLLDETNPLESGVDVIAQPPGKKVQNMGLLSGGEKSLTSLAFLFALFRYKPTPFCILDEVDAALDEVNLARFLDLMRTIKSETQFIIITHNYKTMEVADYIYGTTMEEPNVTKVFSMKLEKKGDGEAVD
ncbi:MAG: chromosome segregation protein SMC [Candidatus Aminicenantes bacterium]|nr:chromosome segregation protein SMC [Candidatus Aminicenantes bacterium]